MTIIDNSYETLTVLDKNKKLLIRSINEYNLLKYRDFDGKQIHFKLGNVEVLETFNEGIFNIKVGDHKLQTHNKNEMAKRIIFCRENKTNEPIIEMLRDELTEEINREFFGNVLSPFSDRIVINKEDDSIIIDGYFKVDKNGQASVLKAVNNTWKFVCIVAGDPKFKHQISHTLGKFKIDFRTTEIYFKVLFLLFPDSNDKVFFNQLPTNIKNKIKPKEVKK